MLDILDTGPLSTVQDLGRFGYADLGVGRSGAADLPSHRLANRLVGNLERAATIEVTFGGLRVRAVTDLTLAVTGALGPVHLDGRRQAANSPLRLVAGTELALGPPGVGLRTYLAVRGGIDVEPVLGSRSTDVLSGLGPPSLRRGQRLAIGTDTAADPLVDHAPVPPLPAEPVLRVLPGPRPEQLGDGALDRLLAATWTATQDSNRVGVRLDGPALLADVPGDLPSDPLVPGAVQVPLNARPLIFLADHPVTGGYPVLAVVRAADLGVAAQLRPGQRVRFRTG